MSEKPSGTTPPLPTFPDRLSLSNAIWETVITKEEDGEEIIEEMGEEGIGEFMDDGFREDLRKLEEHWFKEAARLTSYLVSPIHDSAAKGNIGGLEQFVVEEKQDVDSRDNVLNTPLHYAAKAGHIEAVEWLLDHGADINALNANDDTPLHSAVWRRYFEVVKVLCARGCDRDVVNKQGKKAIDLVRDVDIGAEIQSYDPIEEDDIEDRYEYIDDGGEDEDPEATD